MKTCVLLLALVANSGAAFAASERATRVHVDKSDRLMTVYAGERVIARYRIGLGTRPQGHKTQEGDRRTPEGRYTLDFKKRDSTFSGRFTSRIPMRPIVCKQKNAASVLAETS